MAEIGNNHQGDQELAEKMVEEAARMGVQGVKFQKRNVDAMFTREGLDAPYSGSNSFGSTYGEHRRALELSVKDMAARQEPGRVPGAGLLCLGLGPGEPGRDARIGHGAHQGLLRGPGQPPVPAPRGAHGPAGHPVHGMSTLEEIDLAVSELRRFHDQIVVLQCNSTYPCDESLIGLPVMELYRRRYKLPVGYSGHERGLGPSVGAAALGACVIERHFTLDKTMRGTDHQASLEPQEFADLARMVREVEQAMQLTEKTVFPQEEACASKLRKSIVFTRDLPKGHVPHRG